MAQIVSSYVQERAGTEFSYVSETHTQTLGNVILNTSVVHSARARDIIFAANGLRPSATLYPFFDSVSVQAYVQQANVLQLDPVSANTYPDGVFYVGQVLYVKKRLTGNVDCTSSNSQLTGSSTFFDYELLPNQLVRIELGANAFDRYITSVANNTSTTLTSTAPLSFANASISTLTRVVVADTTPRYSGTNKETITYTLKVVRAQQDADSDDGILGPRRNYGVVTTDGGRARLALPEEDGVSYREFNYTAGGLNPQKMKNDAGSATNGASIIVGTSSRLFAALQTVNTALIAQDVQPLAFTVNTAIIASGVVRDYSANLLRLDVDVTDTQIVAGNTTIYFVGGPGAGQSASITTYHAANQTAVLDTSTLTNITAGQSLYSLGNFVADGYLANSTVTAGGAGTVAGVLHLQEGQFPTGTRLFRLTDSDTNDIAEATTTAESNYTASGLSVVKQEQSIVSRSLNAVRRGVHDALNWENGTFTQCPTGWADPLAETFLVDSVRYPQGVMIASVDLVFRSKPSADIPVTVELRPVINGYPSSYQIVPCPAPDGQATTSLRPDAVNAVTTGLSGAFSNTATFTRFVFPALVHLLPGEYALVIRSDSSDYKVYVAELGASVLETDQKVAKQPYAGSFFKSQNGSTWTESPFEDLMFRLNKATWTLSAGANTATFVARAIQPATNTTFDAVTLYPYEVTFPQITATAYALSAKPSSGNPSVSYTVVPNHLVSLDTRSFLQGSYDANGAPTVYPSFANNVSSGSTVGAGSANTIDIVATLTTHSTDVAPYLDLKKMNAVGVRYLINDMPLSANQFVITTRGTYANSAALTGTVTTQSGNTIITGSGTAFDVDLVVGHDVVLGGNLAVTVASITSATVFVATAAVSETRSANVFSTYAELALTIGASDAGTSATGNAIVSAVSTSNVTGLITSVELSEPGSGYLTTPTITVPSGDGTITYDGETSPQHGNADTRYFTRQVTLAEGFDARDLKVYFNAVRPYGTNFYVYYKILANTQDSARFADQSWRLMTQVTPDSAFSTRTNQYREFEFRTPTNRAYDASTDSTDRFKVFAVKVVMATADTTIVPTIRKFRAIALDE